MSRLNILTASALVALTAIVSCDEQYDYYKVGKNNPTVTTLEVSEEQVGDNWAVLAGSVKWEQSTSNHSFDVRFAVSESPDFPADETDTLYGETSSRKSIAQDDTTTHYYEQAIDGLKQGTTYYYAFSITDGIVEVSGKTQSFTTLGENQDDPNNPTGGPRLVIPEPGYAADAVGSDASVGFVIKNYDVGLYGELSEEMFLVEHGDGGEDWIMDLAYGAVEYGENECTGYVAFIVKPNETDSDRSCSISVRLSIEGVVDQEEFIYITQPSMTAEEPNLVMPEGTEFSVEAEGGDYDTFIPFIIENYSYEYFESHGEPELWIENGADWLSNVEYTYLEYEPGGNCTGYINLTAAPNATGSDRTGSFTFGFNDQSYDITISQPFVAVEELNFIMPEGTEFSVEAEGGDYDTFIPFTIENYSYEYYESHGEPELWIENGADWLSNVEYAYLEYEPGGNCTGYINLTAAPNTTGSDRTGSFIFGFEEQSYNVSITQSSVIYLKTNSLSGFYRVENAIGHYRFYLGGSIVVRQESNGMNGYKYESFYDGEGFFIDLYASISPSVQNGIVELPEGRYDLSTGGIINTFTCKYINTEEGNNTELYNGELIVRKENEAYSIELIAENGSGEEYNAVFMGKISLFYTDIEDMRYASYYDNWYTRYSPYGRDYNYEFRVLPQSLNGVGVSVNFSCSGEYEDGLPIGAWQIGDTSQSVVPFVDVSIYDDGSFINEVELVGGSITLEKGDDSYLYTLVISGYDDNEEAYSISWTGYILM